jgi:hypothetical protein
LLDWGVKNNFWLSKAVFIWLLVTASKRSKFMGSVSSMVSMWISVHTHKCVHDFWVDTVVTCQSAVTSVFTNFICL